MEMESKLGKQTYAESVGSRPVYTVSDDVVQNQAPAPPQYVSQSQQGPIQMSPEDIKRMEAMRSQAQETQSKISPQNRLRVEILAGIGRMENSVEVDGVKFTMQSLKVYEQEEIFDYVASLDKASAIRVQFEFRVHTLARAIYAIDDQPLNLVVGSNALEDKVLAMRYLDENVADYLYKWYQENIVDKAQQRFAVKNEKDAEEVIEAVKKS